MTPLATVHKLCQSQKGGGGAGSPSDMEKVIKFLHAEILNLLASVFLIFLIEKVMKRTTLTKLLFRALKIRIHIGS